MFVKNSEKIVRPDLSSFEDLLDETCERLWDKKKQHTLQRLRELDDHLTLLEQKLEKLLVESHKDSIN
jgi:TfoX/Sxy family transcriptional regulator of competence genes